MQSQPIQDDRPVDAVPSPLLKTESVVSASSCDRTLHDHDGGHITQLTSPTNLTAAYSPILTFDRRFAREFEPVTDFEAYLDGIVAQWPAERQQMLALLQERLQSIVNKCVVQYVSHGKERVTSPSGERQYRPVENQSGDRQAKLYEWIKTWATRDCLWRYLRASKWDFDGAVKRLESTISWRLDFRPDLINTDAIAVESESGKMYLNGFDYKGRPLLLMKPRRQNTKPTTRQIDHLVFLLESAIRLMPDASVEQLVLLIDFEGFTMGNSPSLSVSKEFLTIVGNHYPERLGVAYLISPTWYFTTFFKLVSPFIDPITRSKLWTIDLKTQHQLQSNQEESSEVKGMAQSGTPFQNKSGMAKTCLWNHIHKDCIEKPYGGSSEFVYSHQHYWNSLVSLIKSHPNPF